MSKIKNPLLYLISLIFMFTLLFMQVSLFINARLLNGDFYKVVLSKSDYFVLMNKEIDFGFKNLSMITSIPKEVLSKSISKEEIRDYSWKNINSAEDYMKYEGKNNESKIDTKKIYDNIEKYAQDNNVIDGQLKNQLAAVAADTGKIIENHTALFKIDSVAKYSQFQSLRKVLFLIYKNQVLSIFIILILVILLILINWARLSKTLLWIGSSLIASSLITLIPSIMAIYFRIPYKYAIDIPYLKVALRDISIGFINYFVATGLMFFCLGLMCMVIYSIVSNKPSRR